MEATPGRADDDQNRGFNGAALTGARMDFQVAHLCATLEFGENLGNHELNFRTIFSISHFAYQFLHKGFILAR